MSTKRRTAEEQTNVELARRYYEEMWNTGNLEVIDEVYSADFYREWDSVEATGTDGIKEYVGGFREAFPDIEFEIKSQVAEGDSVATRWEATATHEGEFMGFEATHAEIAFSGIAVFNCEDGAILTQSTEWDKFGLHEQLEAAEQS